MSFDLSKIILQPDQGETLIVGPPATGKIIIKIDKIDPKNTGEMRLAMGTEDLEPGGAIPVHLHEGLEELIFVYAGQGKGIIGDDEAELSSGTTIYVPRQAWHGITNTGTEMLRMTWTVCPPGLENFFREMGRPVIKAAAAPAPAGPPDLQAFVAMAQRHGVKIKL